MSRAWLSLGSNIEPRRDFLRGGVKALGELSDVSDQALVCSSLYETEAWGVTGQAAYLNLALRLPTTLEPEALLRQLHRIETEHGRARVERWGARTLDIDLLLYDELRLETETLVIPHPRLTERRFVLQPLSELDPNLKHPALQRSIAELLAQCTDLGRVQRLGRL